MVTKFKAGDRIICTFADSTEGALTEGAVYVAAKVVPGNSGFEQVWGYFDTPDLYTWYNADRFELASSVDAPFDPTKESIKQYAERDPSGISLNTPGAKADAGKVRPALVLGGFARALLEVSKVGTYGAVKYTDNGWQAVPDGERRYDDANLRHWLNEKAGQTKDTDTALLHAAHAAWNALARLDLMLREAARADKAK
jgi:hypothetical protein